MLTEAAQKKLGAFYTPSSVAQTLVNWVVRRPGDRLLDPSCGDGRFLAMHRNSVGVECDAGAVVAATRRNGDATIHAAGFFQWASACTERFDCVAGNPPFIRYQNFVGRERDQALRSCARIGARFTSLTSSWAPFLVVAASLLKSNGRLAFVVPAEVGHAPYATPLLEYLQSNFSSVQVVALREKLFPDLSEDVWILYAEGFGGSTDVVLLSEQQAFLDGQSLPRRARRISKTDLAAWNGRLRPFLLSDDARELYRKFCDSEEFIRLGEVARVGIGYVTGANDFFHLRPSAAKFYGIPDRYLMPTVRNGKYLPPKALTQETVSQWLRQDEPVLLLRLPKQGPLPRSVQDFLATPGGVSARTAYKCRNRKPWYVVPDVKIPDGFLAYMSGELPNLVPNRAGCTCTNSVHAVSMTDGWDVESLRRTWNHPLVALSCEVEGTRLAGAC